MDFDGKLQVEKDGDVMESTPPTTGGSSSNKFQNQYEVCRKTTINRNKFGGKDND